MKEIELTRGQFALVDDDEWEIFRKFKWTANKGNSGYYAIRGVVIKGVTKRVFMHRVIVQARPFEIVDHRNGNTLDNRRENLKIRGKTYPELDRALIGRESRYKGVGYYHWTMQWSATFNGKHIGYFDCEIDAALAYNLQAWKHTGDWSLLNKIPGLSRPELISFKEYSRKRGYRGVRQRSRNSWEANIQVGNRRYTHGCFKNDRDAAIAYNNLCDKLGCPTRKNYIKDNLQLDLFLPE